VTHSVVYSYITSIKWY